METPQHIEALLFVQGTAMSYAELGKILELPEAEIRKEAQKLSEELEGRGITLVRTDTTLALTTAPEASSLVQKFQTENESESLGQAALETLAIVLYKSPITRSEIEYIRGVTASTSIRTLLMRGLITRATHPTDKRSFVYMPTTELLAHLGVTSVTDLPQYNEFMRELSALEETFKEQETHE